jgi:hypothetical protein
MHDVLPAELIFKVMTYLDPANIQDLHTLTACNLVSLTISAASSAVLFHTICISTELTVHGFYERSACNYAAIIDLKSILSQSPHLSELVRVIYLDDLDPDAQWWKVIPFETGNIPLLKSFCNVQSLYIFGWDGLPTYNYVSQNLECFPKLCNLAVSNARLSKFNPAPTNSRVYWQNDIIVKPDEAFKPAGMSDVPLNGTENWCLTRKLGTDGVSGKWTLSAVKVSTSGPLIGMFSTDYPKILWSIPQLTMPITFKCTSFAA